MLNEIIVQGITAKELFNSNPDSMNQGHQDWVKGLAKTVVASKNK